MAVPSWKRKVSKTQFLYLIYELNITLGHISGSMPKKYSNSYGDILIRNASEALKYANAGNDIRVNSLYSLRQREDNFRTAVSNLDNIATMAYIYFEIVKHHDGIDPKLKSKIKRWEEDIGGHVDDSIKMITAIIKSDRRRYRGLRES